MSNLIKLKHLNLGYTKICDISFLIKNKSIKYLNLFYSHFIDFSLYLIWINKKI